MAEILGRIDDILYTWCLIYLLAGAGIFFTVKTRFAQIDCLRNRCGACLRKSSPKAACRPFRH